PSASCAAPPTPPGPRRRPTTGSSTTATTARPRPTPRSRLRSPSPALLIYAWSSDATSRRRPPTSGSCGTDERGRELRRLPEGGAPRPGGKGAGARGGRAREAQLGPPLLRLQQPLHLLPRLQRPRRHHAEQPGHQGPDRRGPEEGRPAAHPL